MWTEPRNKLGKNILGWSDLCFSLRTIFFVYLHALPTSPFSLPFRVSPAPSLPTFLGFPLFHQNLLLSEYPHTWPVVKYLCRRTRFPLMHANPRSRSNFSRVDPSSVATLGLLVQPKHVDRLASTPLSVHDFWEFLWTQGMNPFKYIEGVIIFDCMRRLFLQRSVFQLHCIL